ncbi:MAG: hypothetical protein EOM03_17345 [Clostridia bacterium]|nr:hypothetical protein [Clostridia bacterium]
MSNFLSLISSRLSSKIIFILGSGPSASLKLLRKSHVLVCANGSLDLVKGRSPDILFVNSPTLTGNDAVAQRSRKNFNGRYVETVVCITKDVPFSECLLRLKEMGLKFSQAVEMTGDERRAVTDSPAKTHGHATHGHRPKWSKMDRRR